MAFKLRYSDVVLTVIRLVVLLYMKLSEINQVTNRSMFKTLSSIMSTID